jgi:lipoprotein-anchoring transpeptidase ErfK/SrfK
MRAARTRVRGHGYARRITPSRKAALTILVVLTALAAGCGDDDGEESTVATSTDSEGQAAEADSSSSGGTEIYFTAGEQFEKVERDLPSGERGLTAATEALVEGPTQEEAAGDVETVTQIPESTQVGDVSVDGDGTARVELSSEFTAGIPADPARRTQAEESELDARLAQVTYTLTGFPEVDETTVLAGGEPVEPQPTLARADYAEPEKGPRSPDRPKGARPSSVRDLQTRLAQLKYLPKRAVDGAAGYQTTQAVIAFQSWRGLERDGIVGPQTSAALKRASPPKPKGQGPSRRIEVYRDKGVALLIAGGEVKRAIHVSAGAPGTPTPAGTFKVFRKERQSWSVPFQTWLPYASYFNNGIAFHEYHDVPTYPASHGCVRVPAPEAKGLYEFASVDTAVIVF